MKAYKVVMVQRSIPHYRLPLFQKLQAQSRHQWTFFCDDHGKEASSGLPVALDGLRVGKISQLHLGSRWSVQLNFPVSSKAFDAVLADYGWTILSNPVNFLRARRAGMATLGWTKGLPQVDDERFSGIKRAYQRVVVSLCDALVVYGQLSRTYFQELGVPPDKIFVAQNTIDTTRIDATREEAKIASRALANSLQLDNKRPVAGFLGKVIATKKVCCIIRAFEVVRAQGLDFQLLLAGDGPDLERIKALSSVSNYKDDIYFLQHVPSGSEDAVFQLMDIYLTYSQAGLGVLEAMAHQLPIVATPEKFPETELLIDGETAFVASDQTVADFAKTIARALHDRDAAKSIGERARETVLAHATLEKMVEKIDAAVDYAVSKKNSINKV